MDFAAELEKLLQAEESPPLDLLEELAMTQAELLGSLQELLGSQQQNNESLSLQVEEIYDIVKESDENAKEVKAAAKRENMLVNGLISLCDLVDGLLPHLQEHSRTVDAKKMEAVDACGLEPLGFPGERLDPRLHTVAGAEYSDAPMESVIRVLESGYAYHEKLIRKATVILSKGAYVNDCWY